MQYKIAFFMKGLIYIKRDFSQISGYHKLYGKEIEGLCAI